MASGNPYRLNQENIPENDEDVANPVEMTGSNRPRNMPMAVAGRRQTGRALRVPSLPLLRPVQLANPVKQALREFQFLNPP
jgi:hypothetical protein